MKFEIVLVASFAAIVIADLSISFKWFNTKRISTFAEGFVINSAMLIQILTFLLAKRDTVYVPVELLFYINSSLWKCLLLPAFVLLYASITLIINLDIKSKSITRGSVREAVNKMECGLMYSEEGGTVILMNNTMSNIVKKLTGSEVRDADVFWEKVISFSENEHAMKIDFSSGPSFVFSTGEVWSFRRAPLKDADRNFTEIVARDVTDLFQKSNEMKAEIKELEEIEVKLYGILKSIAEQGNQEELLNYKISIHDRLGNAVLRIRQLLRNDSPDDGMIRNVIGIWGSTVKAFKDNRLDTADKENRKESLLKLAGTLGIDLSISGNYPLHSELAARAVREAMYNAIRHAYANHINVECYKSREGHHLHISDDGHFDGTQVTEGGGLKSLRRAIEECGGSMAVSVDTGVVLDIFVREEKEDD